jgi:tetratricopeptide (TPR) repeat protein
MAVLVHGQAIDTVMFRDTTDAKRFTIIDQVDDPHERRAFLKLYRASDPQKRRALAEGFIEAYPQSWLLAQAYEIAAKSCIDLDDYGQAMQFGSESLGLFPENTLLLVPLANVAVQLQQLDKAKQSARAALDYLEWFDRPAAVAAAGWPALQAELKASSYFVLGRVAVAEALRDAADKKRQKLLDAEDFLIQARIFNARDAEINYLLGLTELSLGEKRHAAFYFAQAGGAPGPLQSKSIDNLRQIYRSEISKSAGTFDSFLASAERDGELKATAHAALISSSSTSGGGYAGSRTCQPCHAEIDAAWRKTGMARMLRPFQPENVIGDFRVNNQFSDTTGTLVARMSVSRDKYYFAIRDKGGDWRTYPVSYTIGSKWQQAYATLLPNGDIHVFPIQYNAIEKKWVNYWKVIDPPGFGRAEVTAFSEFNPATSYQPNCAPCHTSQLKIAKPGSSSPHDYEFREAGINCEMCHGPARNHVLAMTSGNSAAHTAADFRTIGAREYVAICGQCHAQSALREPGEHGELNYITQGASFPPTYLSRPYADVARRAFYKDGRFRETTFIVEAFRRTACFRKGQAHCGHCHQPHAADSGSNRTSLKFAGDPDRMCLGCHSQFAANVSAHTHHVASSEASRCVNCHMPRIMNSVLFKARTHQIDDIPSASMTERFGPKESPNACLLCHAEKDAAWAALKLRAW